MQPAFTVVSTNNREERMTQRTAGGRKTSTAEPNHASLLTTVQCSAALALWLRPDRKEKKKTKQLAQSDWEGASFGMEG